MVPASLVSQRLLQVLRGPGFLWKASRQIGWKNALQLALINLDNRKQSTYSLQIPKYPHPVVIRGGHTSDPSVLYQLLVVREYAFASALKPPALIIDCGANIGIASLYFLNCYPAARIVSIEPDPGNFAICGRNLAPYADRVTLIRGAVWFERTRLRLSTGAFADGREWATQVIISGEETPGDVEAWDMGSLIDLAGQDVDLLKIDIERAELSVFNNTSISWLTKVRNICIELHGPDCRDAFFAALSNFDYDLRSSGELTLCLNLRAKHF